MFATQKILMHKPQLREVQEIDNRVFRIVGLTKHLNSLLSRSRSDMKMRRNRIFA